MPFAPYEPARSCRSAGDGATALMYWLDRESPWAATLGNYGVYNCRLPSIHSEERAGDSAVPVVKGGHPVGHQLVEFLTDCGLQLGVMETIFARSRRSASHPGGKAYTGPSPHWDHVHWALSRLACAHLNVPTIRAVYAAWVARRGGAPQPAPGPAPKPPVVVPQPEPSGDDDMQLIRVIDPKDRREKYFLTDGFERDQVSGDEVAQWNAVLGTKNLVGKDAAAVSFFRATRDIDTRNAEAFNVGLIYSEVEGLKGRTQTIRDETDGNKARSQNIRDMVRDDVVPMVAQIPHVVSLCGEILERTPA